MIERASLLLYALRLRWMLDAELAAEAVRVDELRVNAHGRRDLVGLGRAVERTRLVTAAIRRRQA